LGQEVGTKLLFNDVPFVGGIICDWGTEAFMADHWLKSSRTKTLGVWLAGLLDGQSQADILDGLTVEATILRGRSGFHEGGKR
jgi:hypothetical protein